MEERYLISVLDVGICMNKSFTYNYPVVSPPFNQAKPELWAKVQDAWEQKAYKNTLLFLLEYLGTTVNKTENNFELKHGSITIYFCIKETELEIKAPFLDISDGQKIPLLRQATQLNFEPLTITQIVLEEDNLLFRFSCALERCEPYKIFEVLKEICIHADNYDDAFIRRFKAKRIVQPSVSAYEPPVKLEAVLIFRKILEETKDAINFLDQKRMHAYTWDVLILMLLRIDFSISPQGHLRGRIEHYISEMLGTFDLSEKINLGRAALKELSLLKDEEVMEDLYFIQTLVPFKSMATAETVKSRLSKALLQVEKEYQEGQYLACTLTIPYHLLYLLYEYSLDATNYKLIKDLLPECSGKDFKTAAEYLKNGLSAIVSNIQKLPVVLPEIDATIAQTPIMSPIKNSPTL